VIYNFCHEFFVFNVTKSEINFNFYFVVTVMLKECLFLSYIILNVLYDGHYSLLQFIM
jgi:hypothetical protein